MSEVAADDRPEGLPGPVLLGALAAFALAALALLYGVLLTGLLVDMFTADRLSRRDLMLSPLYVGLCPLMMGIAFWNAVHFVRLFRTPARPAPRGLRAGLWLIASVWVVFTAIAIRFGALEDPGALPYIAGPALLALLCLNALRKGQA
ncbi:hypothetical protein [Sagittula sp. MA-2]|uniref:hypothetical protein n=1 Tax=Sagittula sp. MA-2 TaxID=3048007 RepID=UPI0024C3EFAF|nr:hypothetical protein [Sagittula sp. MA-2]WHZ34739.1 hypothetical protein QNI11_19160 [Sagittula sp. MA-2]